MPTATTLFRDVPHSWELSTEPTEEPVTLKECKDVARILNQEEDYLIRQWITTARQEVEHDCQVALFTQTWKLYMDYFPSWEIELWRPPVASISSVQYIDTEGDTQTWAATNYRLDSKHWPGRLTPEYSKSWPTPRLVSNSVTITFVSGYTDVDDIPQNYKQMIRLKVSMYILEREGLNWEQYMMAYNSLVSVGSWGSKL